MRLLKRSLMVSAVVALIGRAALFYVHDGGSWQQVGDYKFKVVSVESMNHQYEGCEPVHHEVWITLRVERSDAYAARYRQRNGQSPVSLYDPSVDYMPAVVRHMSLVTPDGDRLPPMDIQEDDGSYFWDDWRKRGVASSHGVRLVFDNPGHEPVATLTADIFAGQMLPTGNTTPSDTWPQVGTLRYANVSIP